MNELFQFITSQLTTVHPDVFVERAPQGTLMPYITYSMPTSVEHGYRIDFSFYVDVWDNNSSTVLLEQLTDKVDQLFNRTVHNGLTFSARFYRENRLQVPDPDENVRHRQLKFTCMAYLYDFK